MNRERIMPGREGEWFGLESQYVGPILVIRAINVTDMCSLWFATAGNKAVIEYGRLSDGTPVCHLATLFRDSSVAHIVSGMYEYRKMTKEAHRDFQFFADYWGPSTVELMKLVLQYAPPEVLILVA